MKRGELYWVASFKEFGKIRPAVVVQADEFFDSTESVTTCLLTGMLLEGAEFFRIDVPATEETGLDKPSQIMVDKLMTFPKSRFRERIGRVPPRIMTKLENSMEIWLSL